MSAPTTSPGTPLRLLIVEDEGVMRHLLTVTLQRHFPDAEVAACGTGAEAVAYSRQLRPALAVLDYMLPDVNGLEVARVVREHSPRTRMLMLTARVTDVPAPKLLEAGVTGLVDKCMAGDQLLGALRCVLDGGIYFVAERPPAGLSAGAESPSRPPGPEVLTSQECEVARLVASGLSAKEISVQLAMPVRTVEKQRARVQQKLRLPTLAALVRWCLLNGLG